MVQQKSFLAALQSLGAARSLLSMQCLSTEIFTFSSPGHSSVGAHMRHILNFFECMLDGVASGDINFIARNRNKKFETSKKDCLQYLNSLMDKLNTVNLSEEYTFKITDDLGFGEQVTVWNFDALLGFLVSHTTHHFALIASTLAVQDFDLGLLPVGFGMNPTTPQEQIIPKSNL